MKKGFVLSAMLLFVLLGWSQTASVSQQINIKYKNGNSVQIDANDVDYIEFKETESNPVNPNPGNDDNNGNGDMAGNYLTFVAQETGTFKFNGRSGNDYISYSLDNGNTWNTLASNTNSPTVQSGNKIMWKGNLVPAIEGIGTFSSTGRFDVEGNSMSLFYGDDFRGQTDLVICPGERTGGFGSLFYGCTGLTSAENLVLPATTLEGDCYYGMFDGCTSLTTAPELPATTLAYRCYYGMFAGCENLTTAPALPATTLVDECYGYMFYGCESLRTVPSNLLPATTLAKGCYCGMFYECRGLTTPPELPATTLAWGCYAHMFGECTSLTTAPQLPATTLAGECYWGMFDGCFRLTTAPELPATTLEYWCYNSMFCGCKGLTSAPVLPAPTLVTSCYDGMFMGCSNINYIKCLATNRSDAYDWTTDWVAGVSSSGTFVKASSMSEWSIGVDGIPSGWTVQNE